jgi:small subunit ribosomal protein S21
MPSVTQKFKNEPFDKMLRRFRNQCERAGIVKRCRDLQYYEKPNVTRNEKNQQLKRRKKNDALKQAKLESRRRQNRSNSR